MTKMIYNTHFNSNHAWLSIFGNRTGGLNKQLHCVLSPRDWLARIAKTSTCFCALLLVLSLSTAQPASAQTTLTLKQAIDSAMYNRKNIQASKLTLAINRLQTTALLKKYWPQASLEYTYQYNPVLQTSVLPISEFNPTFPAGTTKSVQFGTKWSQTAGLTVSQPLFDASISRQINEFGLQEKIAAASQLQTEYELAFNVAQAYLNTALQQAQIQSAIADTARTWVSYQLQKNRFDEKRLLKSDVNKAIINHNNALQKLADAVAQLVENKVYLLFLIGQANNPNADVIIDTAFFHQYQPKTAASNDFADSIPEIQKLKLQALLPALQIRSEKAKYLPTLGLKGFVGANQYTNTFNPAQPNTWFGLSYVGLDVKLPLLVGEDKQNKIQQLKIQASQLAMQREDLSAQYTKDAATALLKLNRIKAQLSTFEENIQLETETIQIIQQRLTEGQETANTLNTEEATLQGMNAEYEKTKKQWWLYWLDYLKSSGQLSQLWH